MIKVLIFCMVILLLFVIMEHFKPSVSTPKKKEIPKKSAPKTPPARSTSRTAPVRNEPVVPSVPSPIIPVAPTSQDKDSYSRDLSDVFLSGFSVIESTPDPIPTPVHVPVKANVPSEDRSLVMRKPLTNDTSQNDTSHALSVREPPQPRSKRKTKGSIFPKNTKKKMEVFYETLETVMGLFTNVEDLDSESESEEENPRIELILD